MEIRREIWTFSCDSAPVAVRWLTPELKVEAGSRRLPLHQLPDIDTVKHTVAY
jgi:hypothetical protein